MLMYFEPSRFAELMAAFESSGIWSRNLSWITISISTVRFGSRDPESLMLPIYPTRMPFTRTGSLATMPAESSM